MKQYVGKTLTSSEVFKFLKNFFGNSRLQREIANRCFVKSERGKYFIPKEPIYIEQLQNCYNNISIAKRNNKQPSISINDAIKVLKANNYVIYKESLDVEKALKNPTKPVELFIVKELV
jgi:hypothetical protein